MRNSGTKNCAKTADKAAAKIDAKAGVVDRKFIKGKFPVEYGDEGDLVKDVQERLALLGSRIKPNGKFTIGMTTAVKSWQKKNKLQVSGKLSAFQYDKLVRMTDPLKKPAKAARKKA